MVLMLLLYKGLAMLQLFLTLDPILQPTHAVSTTSPITRTRMRFITAVDVYEGDDGDYADGHSDPTSAATSSRPNRTRHELCRYDPCREDQPPCADLAAQNSCLCPGLSGASQPPHPPRLQALDGSGGGVAVRWCAPSSVVTGYRVVVDGDRGAALEFGAQARQGPAGPLEAGAEVCVEAVNAAGHSAVSEFSCMHYHSQARLGSSGLAGLIGGGVVILLLLVFMALGIHWRRRARRKTTREEGATEGLGNPSYSAEGNL